MPLCHCVQFPGEDAVELSEESAAAQIFVGGRSDNQKNQGRRRRSEADRRDHGTMSMKSEGGDVACCRFRSETTTATHPVQVGTRSATGRNSMTKVGSNSG